VTKILKSTTIRHNIFSSWRAVDYSVYRFICVLYLQTFAVF